MGQLGRSSSPVRCLQSSARWRSTATTYGPPTTYGALSPRPPLAIPVPAAGAPQIVANVSEDLDLAQKELDLAEKVESVSAKAANLLKAIDNRMHGPARLHDLMDRLARLETLLDKVNVVGVLQPSSSQSPLPGGAGLTPRPNAVPAAIPMGRSSGVSTPSAPLLPPTRRSSRVEPMLAPTMSEHSLRSPDANFDYKCSQVPVRRSSGISSPAVPLPPPTRRSRADPMLTPQMSDSSLRPSDVSQVRRSSSRNRRRPPASAREAYETYCERYDYEELRRSLSPRPSRGPARGPPLVNSCSLQFLGRC